MAALKTKIKSRRPVENRDKNQKKSQTLDLRKKKQNKKKNFSLSLRTSSFFSFFKRKKEQHADAAYYVASIRHHKLSSKAIEFPAFFFNIQNQIKQTRKSA